MASKTPRFFAEVGDTGLNRSGGFVRDEFLLQLDGERGRRVYRQMADNDAMVGGFLLAVTSMIRGVEWRVDAPSDSPGSVDAKVLVEEAMDDMAHTWGDMIEEIMTMLVFGWAAMEVTWKRRAGPRKGIAGSRHDDGKIAWAKVALRAQDSLDRWEFDEAGDVVGMHQMTDEGRAAFIPAEKLALFRTSKVKNNPEGRSVLRAAYRAWYYKTMMEETEGVGVARDLAGLPVARVPGHIMADDASAEEKAQYKAVQAIVANIKRDKQSSVVLPSDRDDSGNFLYDLLLLSTGGSRQHDTSTIIDRWNRSIATALLSDFMLLGQQSVGSFALSSDKTDLFATALGGFLKIIVDTAQARLVNPLCEYNGIPEGDWPQLAHGDIESPDLDALSGFVSALTNAGHIVPDPDLQNHLRRAAHLPEAPESEDGTMGDPTMEAVPAAGPGAQHGAGPGEPPAEDEPPAVTPADQEAPDDRG